MYDISVSNQPKDPRGNLKGRIHSVSQKPAKRWAYSIEMNKPSRGFKDYIFRPVGLTNVS